ncbi:dynamin family protein [Alkalihalobacterium alkalinitrilicum]|uniref:dynamin family protein n=1 Tax=Alkalihalobacterium alkalinitrilicum TaxID=427920 RepID=UPI000995B18B|nr:dynamin family protein [Alkalihalobacterium alkalinitrilicum]
MQLPTSLQDENVFINSMELVQVLHGIKRTLENDDYKNSKIDEITEKIEGQQYGIAFCGHFSAGKSTLINDLLGEYLLPASPIPTSANVVKMMSGLPRIIVEFATSTKQSINGMYDHEVIQQYCKDGDNVTKLTIYSDQHGLPKDLFILDTPGIDSTDDAHKLAAESALHIADIVVYMMDFNHVQSEMNYTFLKEMNRRYKKLIIVVNQIDKHQRAEMSFEEFKTHTIQSIENEKITFEAIFFTSAVNRLYPNNELNKLKSYLEQVIAKRQQLLPVSVWKEVFFLLTEYEQWLRSSYKSRYTQFQELLSPYHIYDESFLRAELEQMKMATKPHSEVIEECEETFLLQFNTLLNNANLMPYHTRNLARDFLEAEQIGYKVRGLFTAKKTKMERERRREALFRELNDNAVTYIDIHLKDMFFKLLKNYQIRDNNLIQAVHKFAGQLQLDVIVKSQKKGALYTHEYVLNFSKTLMEEVKLHYRKKANELLGLTIETLNKTLLHQTKEKIRKRDDLERKMAACVGIREMNEEIETKVRKIVEKLEAIVDHSGTNSVYENSLISFKFKERSETKEQKRKCINLSELGSERVDVKSLHFKDEKERRLRAAVHIENMGKIIEKLPSMKRIGENFFQQSKRLKEKKFTIALFGAFSAGKSSFANALVGANVLPVSPHPTTATINRILPPTDEDPHGTIYVFYKKEELVLSEVNEVLRIVNKSIASLDELKLLFEEREKKRKEVEESDDEEKNEDEQADLFELLNPNQLQYLTFIMEGYHEMNERFGKSVSVSNDKYKKLVATERFAACIERIDVFYDSLIARQGITLVDTPGANSSHARHTELAFNFIKHADALVFVTYYNHAFSRSDKEFLIQLGRVKNCFETDKMYFIINAADLAQSQEEMKLVTSHVEKNLLQCGIRFPQIYPVSSQLALLAKVEKQRPLTKDEKEQYKMFLQDDKERKGYEYSGIAAFDASFYSYIITELTNVAIRAADEDIIQLSHTLKKWYEDANKGEASKRLQRDTLRQVIATKKAEIISESFGVEEQFVRQEIQELFYYVKQRVFYRYFDEFKELINPTNFTNEANFSQQLRLGVHGVLQFLSHDLLQELRATTFRLEVYIKKCLNDIEMHIVGHILKEDDFSLLRYEMTPLEEVKFQSFSPIQVSDFDEEMKEYVDIKTFFIDKGHQRLRDKVEERLRSPVDEYLQTFRDDLEEIALNWFQAEVAALKSHHISELEQYEQEIERVLSDQTQSILIDKVISEVGKEHRQLTTYVE